MGLLTAGLRARVGETRVYTAPEPVSRASIRYYALAVGDRNPLYTDAAAARAAGLRDVIAPPTLLCDSNQYLGGERDEDGFAGHSWGIEIPGTRLVRGGNDYMFHRPAYPDDLVTVTWRLADLAERTTSAGAAMLIVTSEASVTGRDKDPIVTNTETIIYTEIGEATPAPARSAASPAAATAGDAPAGDELPCLERTIGLTDMVAYAGATWDWHRLHYDPVYLRAKRLPAPVVDGQVFGALLAEQVQDQFGPGARLRRLRFRFKNLVYAGETVRCVAAVSRAEPSGDATLLHIDSRVEVSGENPRVAAGPASAEVLLCR